ncbi:hypothetical protein LguiA_007271 [Lonicera macranthoides]
MESRTKGRHEPTNTTDAAKGKAPAKMKSKKKEQVLKKKLNWVSEFLVKETIRDDEREAVGGVVAEDGEFSR